MQRRRVIIMGAAGRDFHNFNMVFRDNKGYEVMAFTATQIPNIEGREYPAGLARRLYPKGIPILPERKLSALIREQAIDEVVFSYSDVSFHDVMTKASQVNAAGADFTVLGTKHTMLKSQVPRPGHERSYYPGATNVLLADVVVINKVESARREDIDMVRRNIREVNAGALIIEAASPITVEDTSLVDGQRVLVVEDGPTLTHGEIPYGAGTVAARKFGATELIDPRPWLV